MFAPDATAPDPAALAILCDDLGARAAATAELGPWGSGAFDLLARTGVLAGFVPGADGGTGATETAILDALVAISSRCLTTALALTQWASGCRIIAGGEADVRATWLPRLAAGTVTTTVGIAQLSTSRRHLGAPALVASTDRGGWRLTGLCPWVTGADSVDAIVTGAVHDDGQQLFFIVPTDSPGLAIAPPMQMLALSGSRTSSVTFTDVTPVAIIEPRAAGGVRTGGLATTALALGSTVAALAVLEGEAVDRATLAPVAKALRAETRAIEARLHRSATDGDTEDRDRLRADANSLAIRAAQAALTATKGAGFVAGHPAERLVREAHFFLVWSCPQTVAGITLCELSHLDV
ncbi:MAG: acyl-CoA dehydrogenase family protein [Planctomycetia bacterium]